MILKFSHYPVSNLSEYMPVTYDMLAKCQDTLLTSLVPLGQLSLMLLQTIHYHSQFG